MLSEPDRLSSVPHPGCPRRHGGRDVDSDRLSYVPRPGWPRRHHGGKDVNSGWPHGPGGKDANTTSSHPLRRSYHHVYLPLMLWMMSVNGAHTHVDGGCSEACMQLGNCNLDEPNRCECPFGYTGPSCEELLVPACRVTTAPGALMSCEQATEFPKSSEQNDVKYKYYATYRAKEKEAGVEVHQSVVLAKGASTTWVPHTLCPKECSSQGACLKQRQAGRDTYRCRCYTGFHGDTCDRATVSSSGRAASCFKNCSGRGNCSFGFCHCQPGFFGLGCALGGLAPEAPPRKAPFSLNTDSGCALGGLAPEAPPRKAPLSLNTDSGCALGGLAPEAPPRKAPSSLNTDSAAAVHRAVRNGLMPYPQVFVYIISCPPAPCPLPPAPCPLPPAPSPLPPAPLQ
eukprot:gene6555-3208_t